RILDPVFHRINVAGLNAHLPREALHKTGALHVAADQAQREHDPLAIEGILSAQQIDGLDEAGDANNSVAPRRGPYFFEHAGKLNRVIARLCALSHFVYAARNAVAEEAPVGLRVCWRHMRHSIDKAVAQKFGSDPAYHAAGR